jgi:hypothetical protein
MARGLLILWQCLGTEKNKNKYAKCVAGPTTEYTMKSYDYLGGTYERKSSGD